MTACACSTRHASTTLRTARSASPRSGCLTCRTCSSLAGVRCATQASNPGLADRVPGRPATHTFEPCLGQDGASPEQAALFASAKVPTRLMLACYPGSGGRYVAHLDNDPIDPAYEVGQPERAPPNPNPNPNTDPNPNPSPNSGGTGWAPGVRPRVHLHTLLERRLGGAARGLPAPVHEIK